MIILSKILLPRIANSNRVRLVQQEANTRSKMTNYLLKKPWLKWDRPKSNYQSLFFRACPQISISMTFSGNTSLWELSTVGKFLFPWHCSILKLAFIFHRNIRDKEGYPKEIESKCQKCDYSYLHLPQQKPCLELPGKTTISAFP